MKTFALLGKNGGKMKTMADFWLIAPGQTSDRIQEIHMTVLHILIEAAERMIFPENYWTVINHQVFIFVNVTIQPKNLN